MNDFLRFPSVRPPRLTAVTLRPLVEEVRAALLPQLISQSIEVTLDVPKGLTVLVDRNLFRRAVLNLALSALEVMPGGGELVVTAYAGPAWFELEVSDSGPGLSEEVRCRAFKPLFTSENEAANLGLSFVHDMAQAHGGALSVQNCPEGGAAYTIRLPRRAMEAAA